MRVVALPSRSLSAFASSGVEMEFLPRILEADSSSVHLARLEAGGTLGEHPATALQMFALLDGEAEISTGGGARHRLGTGQAVIWESGEVHQTWALTDLTAVIIETSGAFALDAHFTDVPLPD